MKVKTDLRVGQGGMPPKGCKCGAGGASKPAGGMAGIAGMGGMPGMAGMKPPSGMGGAGGAPKPTAA